MIGIPHRVTVYVDKIYEMPAWGEMSVVRLWSGERLLSLRNGDPYVERVRWWRCGSWRSKKRRSIDVKRSQEIPRVVMAPPEQKVWSKDELHDIGFAIGYLIGKGSSS